MQHSTAETGSRTATAKPEGPQSHSGQLTLPRLRPIPTPFALWQVDVAIGDRAIFGDRYLRAWRGYASTSQDASVRALGELDVEPGIARRVVRCFQVGV